MDFRRPRPLAGIRGGNFGYVTRICLHLPGGETGVLLGTVAFAEGHRTHVFFLAEATGDVLEYFRFNWRPANAG